MTIHAVTFDLDGVYFTADSFQRFKQQLPKTVTDEEAINEVFSKSPPMLAFKRGELSEAAYWNYVRSSLGCTLIDYQIADLMANCYQVNQNVVTIVKKVHSLGIRTCICTNNFPTRINALNSKFNFLADFDVQVLSYKVGVTKPDVKIFQALIDQAGCPASEIIFADDKEENVAPAASLGINASVYTGFDSFLSELRHHGIKV